MSETPYSTGITDDQIRAINARAMQAVDRDAELETLRDERDRLREALEQLAILGNEPYYGNSDGNRIAQKALGIDPSAYMTTPAAGGTRHE